MQSWLLPVLFLVCLAGSANGDAQWNIEEITSAPGIYRSVDLVLDQTGRPYVSYTFGSLLMYCVKESGNWEVTTLPVNGVGSVDIELFSHGTPALSTVEQYGYGEVKYIYFNGSQWQTENVGFAYQGTRNACLVIDDNDVPHILYHRFNYVNPYNASTALYYLTRETSGWEDDLILSYNTVDEGTVQQFDLCMIPSGIDPRVIYGLQMYSCSYLDFAWPGDKTEYWNWLTVYYGAEIEDENSMVIDQNGTAHCCCRRYSNLYYSTGGTSGFESELVDSEDGVAEYSDIAVDEMGFPHIVYSSPDGVRYAVRDVGGWQITDLSPAVDIRTVSICIDPSGCPHVVWIDPADYKVMYAFYGESSSVSDYPMEIPGVLEINGVLPNPSGGTAAVQFSVGENTVVDLRVFSVDGRLVWEDSSLYPEGMSSAILPELGTGVYILRAEAMGKVETSCFTVCY